MPYVSHTFDFVLFDYKTTVDSYENDFSSLSDDFKGNGFTERVYSNFNGQAIHSDHDYVKHAFYQYVLRSPIRVRSSDALINFKEVVIIEPGINGSIPGTEDFNDFAVLQGSYDGITWINLLDEYDASDRTDWENAYSNSLPGNSSLYRFRAINLLDIFEVGDEVLIRFLLKANSMEEGWGWAIDNLKIQTDNVITSIDTEALPARFSVYPNPATKNIVTIVHNNINEEGLVYLFNLKGQLVLSKSISKSAQTIIELPADLKNGIYSFIIISGTKTETHKIIIHRKL